MKTAEQIYHENQDMNHGDRTFNTPEQWHILAMKQYAKQVAEQALQSAFEKSKIREDFDDESVESIMHDDYSTNWSELSVDKGSILNTEIKLP